MSQSDSYDALLSSTMRVYRSKLQDNIFGKSPLFWWLNDKGRRKTQNGGFQIMQPVLYGMNSTIDFFDPYDVFDVTPQEGITTAKFDWKNLGGTVSISGTEERKNNGENAIFNLLEAKVMQLEETMKRKLNAYLHGRHGDYGYTFAEAGNSYDSVGGTLITAGGGQFTSLDHIVRQGTGMLYTETTGTAMTHTVGGIQVSITATCDGDYADWVTPVVTAHQNAWWMNYSIPGFLPPDMNGNPGAITPQSELTNVGYALGNSNQNLISGMRTMYNRLPEPPDLGLTSQEVYEIYEGALMPLERFTDTRVGDAGFGNLKFYGMTLMFDQGIRTTMPNGALPTAAAPAVPFYFLNSKSLAWVVDSGRDFVTTPFQTPPNQDAKISKLLLMGNLTVNERRKNGVLGVYSYATTPWAD
jgi:hypothetical protein